MRLQTTPWHRPSTLLAQVMLMAALAFALGTPVRAMATEDEVMLTAATGSLSQDSGVSTDAANEAESGNADSAEAATDTLQDGSQDVDVQQTDDQAQSEAKPGDQEASDEATATDDQTEKEPVQLVVGVEFEAPDGVWASLQGLSLDEGATAWDATQMALPRSGLTYRCGLYSGGGMLVSLTRADDAVTYALDQTTGSGWRLYVNGERYRGSASTLMLSEGDQLTWSYEVATIPVSVSVVGPGGTGTTYWIAPTTVRITAEQSGWDASRMVFEQNGYGEGRLLSYRTNDDGSVELESLAALGENGITGESWQVYVNGVLAQTDVAHVSLRAGDSLCWYYAGNGAEELPAFVERTGAASQSPASAVHVEGSVVQAWSEPMATLLQTEQSAAIAPQLRSSAILCTGIDATAQSQSGALLPVARSQSISCEQILAGGRWQQSLSHVLAERILSGEGGRSAMSLDGNLYYLDSAGSVVSLQLQ